MIVSTGSEFLLMTALADLLGDCISDSRKRSGFLRLVATIVRIEQYGNCTEGISK